MWNIVFLFRQINSVPSSPAFVHTVNETAQTYQYDSTYKYENDPKNDIKAENLNLLNHELNFDWIWILKSDAKNQKLSLTIRL